MASLLGVAVKLAWSSVGSSSAMLGGVLIKSSISRLRDVDRRDFDRFLAFAS